MCFVCELMIRSRYPWRHDRRERHYLATVTLPRIKSSVTLKGKSTRAVPLRIWVRDFSFLFLLPHSLPCANTFLYGTPLLELRKSQISILGARTVMHYQCYTLCLCLNAPSRFVSRSKRDLIATGQLSTLQISDSRYQRSREIMGPAWSVIIRKKWIIVWIFKVVHKYDVITNVNSLKFAIENLRSMMNQLFKFKTLKKFDNIQS